MILITETFEKLLLKVKSISLKDVELEINKHKSWLNNFKRIGELRNRTVIKWYLLSKKVRLVVLFQENNWNYLPFYVAKKETKDWFNISKDSLKELENKLDNVFFDLDSWKYQIIE